MSLKTLVQTIAAPDNESPKILAMFRRHVPAAGAAVLDVGCGYGRNLRLLQGAGYQAVGVEINPVIVEKNRAEGLACQTLEEFQADDRRYDAILMSHIIEHFPPEQLLTVLDGYLDRLAPGGHLVVATPLLSPYFYDDFDHVKPYMPMGLLMVFGGGEGQVQYYARNRLALRDIWFRRSPYRPRFFRGLYFKGKTSMGLSALVLAGAIAFRLSGGLIGRKDGWVGVFQKVGS